MILFFSKFTSTKVEKKQVVNKIQKKLKFYTLPEGHRPNISKSDKFLNALEANGFFQIELKFTTKYLLYQNPKLSMFYIRVYQNKYGIYPLCNSNEWIYKEESFNNFDFDSKNLIFELLKNNEFTDEQLTNK